jgi:malonyl-CoA/methylmalonyl-CoA synthetase
MVLPIVAQASKYKNNTAIYSDGRSFTYEELINQSEQLASIILNGSKDLNEARVAFMVNPGFGYVQTLWAIWQAGGVAVPLCITHPLPSLEYVLEDTAATILILSAEYLTILEPYIQTHPIRVILLESFSETNFISTLPEIDTSRKALILYTSGTTNKPKGVVTTHENIEAQITTLVTSWEWSSSDHVICVLPLHHVHGIINVIGCSMWAGATCTFIPHFSAATIFELFSEGKINVFMAVPTIYFKLIAFLETITQENRDELKLVMQRFRLMVCGSAALPVSVMEKWDALSGQILLERYGMTELGMAISNPYLGERRPGYVGLPLPGVSIKLVNETYEEVNIGEPGEIIVKGKNVFLEYWQKPEATTETFTKDGWFKTGDIAIVEDGYYRIMGRNSVDIIKSGGYKISALEIEEVLRQYDAIDDCAVVGIKDDEWGELIVAAIVVIPEKKGLFDEKGVSDWIVQKMASYKKPRKYLIVNDLPRNAMGKVVKNDVKKLFE